MVKYEVNEKQLFAAGLAIIFPPGFLAIDILARGMQGPLFAVGTLVFIAGFYTLAKSIKKTEETA